MKHIDFSGINSAALAALPSLLSRWLPGGRREGHEYVALNPRRADRSLGSFRINMNTGRWSDFATDEGGGDVVSLKAYLDGTDQAEAARSLAADAPLSAEEVTQGRLKAMRSGASKVPIVPVPADAPAMNFKHPKLGTPSQSWPYRNADGDLVGYVCRWDFIGEDGRPAKDILPVTYCALDKGRSGWRSRGIPAPRPLYGLPALLANPDSMVLIVEGEKARDAARDLFPDLVATTPAHGAKSPHLTDFGPCAGRTVIIWRDYDDAGRTFGDTVAELVRAAGAAKVLDFDMTALGERVIRDGKITSRDGATPEGYDAADALADGWTAEMITGFRSLDRLTRPYKSEADWKADRDAAAASFGAGPASANKPTAEDPGWPFRLGPKGVEKRVEHRNKDTGAVTIEWRWFCSALEVAAETRSADGEDWGRLLLVTDRDGRVKPWAMPMAMLAGDGTAYRERLLGLGLIMAPGKFARDALHEYVSTAQPDTKARCVGRVGWHIKTFTMNTGAKEPARG